LGQRSISLLFLAEHTGAFLVKLKHNGST